MCHRKSSLPSMCVGDVSRCKTEFHTRLSLLAHLSYKRVGSKVRGTSCGILFCHSQPTLLSVEVARVLNNKDHELRKASLKCGLPHHIVTQPAVRHAWKSTAGIASILLAQVSPNSVRRRLSAKTALAFANLRYKPRKAQIILHVPKGACI